jgi:hypothetical protein
MSTKQPLLLVVAVVPVVFASPPAGKQLPELPIKWRQGNTGN